MAAVTTLEPAPELAGDSKSATRRSGGPRRKRVTAQNEPIAGARFFLGKANGNAPTLEREMETENEALLEALKSGQHYFVVMEFSAIADLSKEAPEIRREVVKRETRHGISAPVMGGTRQGS